MEDWPADFNQWALFRSPQHLNRQRFERIQGFEGSAVFRGRCGKTGYSAFFPKIRMMAMKIIAPGTPHSRSGTHHGVTRSTTVWPHC